MRHNKRQSNQTEGISTPRSLRIKKRSEEKGPGRRDAGIQALERYKGETRVHYKTSQPGTEPGICRTMGKADAACSRTDGEETEDRGRE